MKFSYKPYGYNLNVIISDWFPFFGQGLFCGFAFVKRVKYSDGAICWFATEDVIKHEYGHKVSRVKRGLLNFWFNMLWDYLRVWIPHNEKPMEFEANKYKLELI